MSHRVVERRVRPVMSMEKYAEGPRRTGSTSVDHTLRSRPGVVKQMTHAASSTNKNRIPTGI
eukprot:24849-Eustigmatos_ZCMA.PRE.1